jgi:hypothetical protein
MRPTIKRVLGTAAIATALFTGGAATASASVGGPGGGGGYLYPYTYLSESDCNSAGYTLTHSGYVWTQWSCDEITPSGHGPVWQLWLA